MKNSFSFSRYRLLKSKNSAGQILGFHCFPRKYCRAISACDVTDDLCSELEADIHTEPRSLFYFVPFPDPTLLDEKAAVRMYEVSGKCICKKSTRRQDVFQRGSFSNSGLV